MFASLARLSNVFPLAFGRGARGEGLVDVHRLGLDRCTGFTAVDHFLRDAVFRFFFLENIHPAFDACTCTKQSHDNCPHRAEYSTFLGRFEPDNNRGKNEGKAQKCNEEWNEFFSFHWTSPPTPLLKERGVDADLPPTGMIRWSIKSL